MAERFLEEIPSCSETTGRILLSSFTLSIPMMLLVKKSTRGKGDAVVHLHAPDLAEITVVLPPLSEQRRIAAMLRTWDQAIEAISSLQEAATRQRQGLIQALLKSPQGNRTHRLQPVRSGHSAE